MSVPPAVRDRLLALFLLGIVLLNFPILSLASRQFEIGGIPILVAYCFLVWAALVALAAVVAGSPEKVDSTRPDATGDRTKG